MVAQYTIMDDAEDALGLTQFHIFGLEAKQPHY